MYLAEAVHTIEINSIKPGDANTPSYLRWRGEDDVDVEDLSGQNVNWTNWPVLPLGFIN